MFKILIFVFGFIISFEKCEAWFENCDHKVKLQANASVYISSPNIPNNYPPGSSCRYSIEAPLDYEINIQCNLDIYKESSDCSTDYFYISVDGDRSLKDSEYFCGQGYVQRKSSFNRAVLAYTSSTRQHSGQFSCLLTTSIQPCDCGWSTQMRITGGVETKINEYPFMTALVHRPTREVFCGAVIISHYTLLSAAHCFKSYSVYSDISAVVGEHDLRTANETPYTRVHQISSVLIHEGYAPSKGEFNDIALIRVTTPIEWSRGVGPACLPFLYSFANFAGHKADLLGWGTLSFGGPKSPVLMKATVDIISNDQCKQSYPEIVDSQLCTYNPPKDSCQNDSGGPAIVKLRSLFVGGIISYGIACGTKRPGVNTRVTSYLNWIQARTGENFCRKS